MHAFQAIGRSYNYDALIFGRKSRAQSRLIQNIEPYITLPENRSKECQNSRNPWERSTEYINCICIEERKGIRLIDSSIKTEPYSTNQNKTINSIVSF